jgi:Ni/Co efflux regulator RcnB
MHKQPSQTMATPANNAPHGIASHDQGRGSTGGGRANLDRHAYQRNVSAPRHFHAGSYRAPQGYSYRRWSYGQSLPAVYFSRGYWINDYNSYGLMAPPYGLVWVRFGPDALLIDQYNGEIVQVDYGVFY